MYKAMRYERRGSWDRCGCDAMRYGRRGSWGAVQVRNATRHERRRSRGRCGCTKLCGTSGGVRGAGAGARCHAARATAVAGTMRVYKAMRYGRRRSRGRCGCAMPCGTGDGVRGGDAGVQCHTARATEFVRSVRVRNATRYERRGSWGRYVACGSVERTEKNKGGDDDASSFPPCLNRKPPDFLQKSRGAAGKRNGYEAPRLGGIPAGDAGTAINARQELEKQGERVWARRGIEPAKHWRTGTGNTAWYGTSCWWVWRR